MLTQEDVIIIGKLQKMAQPVEIVPLIVAQADNKKKKSLHLSYLQLSDENKLGGEINKIIYSKID
ncbi:hypothetical protein HMPREF9096_01371 [Haemophilus sp. oral taxon 851 str. F0397]|nr:hypothetical protein HMPREF9096_01371 [Haemophilus sp. oral taxon 851 str. F0397]